MEIDRPIRECLRNRCNWLGNASSIYSIVAVIVGQDPTIRPPP